MNARCARPGTGGVGDGVGDQNENAGDGSQADGGDDDDCDQGIDDGDNVEDQDTCFDDGDHDDQGPVKGELTLSAEEVDVVLELELENADI